MGNEFGHPEWIDFPREGNNWSFKHSRRQWNLVDDKELRYDYLNKFDKGMLSLIKKYNVLKSDCLKQLLLDESAMLLSFEKNGLIFLFNFNPSKSFTKLSISTEEIGKYKVIFNSDDKLFGGQGRISQDITYNTTLMPEKENKAGITIYSPSRTALVLQKI
jgi:1,4-alpha-glucan branching enzyme